MSSALSMPEFEVHLADREPFTVRGTQACAVKWDLERARRRWPSQDDAPSLYTAFMTWAGAVSEGRVEKDMPFEAFADDVIKIEYVRDEQVDPTPADPVPA